MLDLGLSKLALISVVALVVIGPEKLPKVARMAGTLFGRAQRYINDVKAEVGRELELEEFRRLQQEVQQTASDVQNSVTEPFRQTGQMLESARDTSPFNERSIAPPPEYSTRKIKEFRRKKLARNSAIPAWYKSRQGQRSHVISAAARVARYRPAKSTARISFF